ncbi:MAG: single-stranded DNA-binding protein [Actinomycetota bacterium]|nr:single-stranded DNA-binding protein [Actinomycetota bacterium]
MAGLPEITLAGTLVAEPELRFTPTGAAVATFTVAANDRRYDPATGQWVDKGATFLRCCLWRQAAENLAESLTKGTRVLLTGGPASTRMGQRRGREALRLRSRRHRDWRVPEVGYRDRHQTHSQHRPRRHQRRCW